MSARSATRLSVPPTAAIDRRLGRRLARRRRELGLTAAALERTLGLPAGIVGRFEKGERVVAAAELLALSRALGVAVGYFFAEAAAAGRWAEVPPGGSGGPGAVAEAARFADTYYRIADAKVRRDILGLIKAAAGGK